MEVENVNYKRFTPSKGMVLKWTERHVTNNGEIDSERMSPIDELIDLNILVGSVEEVPYWQYEDWIKNRALCYCCS